MQPSSDKRLSFSIAPIGGVGISGAFTDLWLRAQRRL
jgi:hypothetical protein